MSSRRFFVGGNWKLNGDKVFVEKLISEFNAASLPSNVEIVVAPTFLYLEKVSSLVRKEIQVSAQNCYFESKGAFTGEIRFIFFI